jgi:MGT family glycosyltransferase
MKGTHISIFNVPTPVHVHPTFSIVATLIRRGYRVSYVTSGRFAPEFSRYGAEVVYIPRLEHPFNQQGDESLPVQQQYSNDFFNLASRTLSLASTFYDKHRPDLILYDAYAFAGLVIANRLGVPAIRITPQLAFDDENLKLPLFPATYVAVLQRFKRRILEFVAQHAATSTSDIPFGRDVPCAYFYTRDLQLNNQAPDPQSIYAGRCAPERPLFGAWAGIDDTSAPAVLVSTSTAIVPGAEYYTSCVRALSGLGWCVLLSLGHEIDAAALGSLPPYARIVGPIPQLMIMPHVEAMICLGGMITTMEAMYHNVPMLMLTHGDVEAEIYAENAQDHGLGIHLPGTGIGADAIREAFVRLTSNDRICDKVREMHQTVKQNPGGEEVVNWLEDHLAASSR